MKLTPSAFSRPICSKSRSVSSAPSAAVGSSNIKQARVQRQRLGDLDLLLRGDAKVAHERRGRSVQSQAVQLLGCAPIHQLAINTAAPHRETPDKHILGDRQVQ